MQQVRNKSLRGRMKNIFFGVRVRDLATDITSHQASDF